MKLAGIMVVMCLLAATAYAQDPAPRPPRPGDGAQDEAAPLTTDQAAQVKAILSRYNSSTLTAESAHSVNEAFRAAGLRNGPGLQQAIRDAGFLPERIGELDPPPGRRGDAPRPGDGRGERRGSGAPPADRPERGRGQGGGYSIDQAISDRAQLNTIAFDGLAFLTGEMGCNTFLPPGKVADFCGFQYMRDVDTNQLGHNTSFVPRVANNVLYVLTDQQKAQLVALGQEQEKLLTEFAYKRFPLIQAFYRQLQNDIPAGSSGLSREAVTKYTADLYELDGTLSFTRAQVLGGIVRSLTDKQKQYLGKMVFNNSASWPELDDQVDKRTMSHTAHVAVMTYASEMFSWYAGSIEADVYFCPERHATYFGSFYMKDIPAMGNPGFSISTSLTGDSGEAFLAALTEPQRRLVTGLVDQQRADLTEIVNVRRQIATELRRFMKEDSVDKDKVRELSRKYGEMDGEISYFYAGAFAEVSRTLTPEQKATLLKLRNLDARYAVKGAYLYSAPIAMPAIANTDFLFAAGVNGKTGFILRSSEVADGGALPRDYTGDGTSSTLPLEWSGAPEGTRSYALIMHHIDPQGVTKWYWTLYNIPADVHSLARNSKGTGTLGNNSVNGRTEYAPPHSQGPGAKTYIYTLYALSAAPQLDVPRTQVNRAVLLKAMQGRILATAELRVVYTRPGGSD
jgi:phosphatidylethanolamine-binding protein (PEBP) family uncharacterized protein